MSPPFGAKRPSATLFVQVLALVVVSLMLAQAINIWVVVQLPRPTPDFYTAAEIAQALQRGPPNAKPHDPRSLIVTLEAAAPESESGRSFTRLRNELADGLGVKADGIRVSDVDPADRRILRDVRDRLAKTGQSRDVPFLIAPFRVSVQQPDGRWLTARAHDSFPSPWQLRIMLWFVITVAAMVPMVWLVSRRLSGSVAVFAEAAERLGRDPNAPPLQIKGPTEIKPAVAAFNEMQDRLRRYVVDRTAMAAAMAHDLRTPLTRLRFRVESAPEALQAKMAADIDEMEAMISASLAYVRDERGQVEHTPMELSSLIESIVDDMAETGAQVSVERADRVVLSADPMGLKRLVTNLIENACKFGSAARCRVLAEDGAAVIQVEDDGPGIAPGDLEKVFAPFYRGEPSRSRETGGSGLGLAAVRSIARAHGGDATVRNRPQGGLIAEVRLPL